MILCYVREPWAYFTSQSLEEQWGDDWNDAPYEHNAGSPYEPSWIDKEKGKHWTIERLAFEGPFEYPDSWQLNSSYSVEMINKKKVPWLVPPKYDDSHQVSIWAGTEIEDFIQLVQSVGGEVYKKVINP